ncbi:HD domain-containing protein [Chitinibacter sp. FCG-7]|uniref:HD domain-containing protein n=1 Tax=Chitinibacter mangrovi TaxID=3153927 RepID=A0AAU7FEL1_9NEIS
MSSHIKEAQSTLVTSTQPCTSDATPSQIGAFLIKHSDAFMNLQKVPSPSSSMEHTSGHYFIEEIIQGRHKNGEESIALVLTNFITKKIAIIDSKKIREIERATQLEPLYFRLRKIDKNTYKVVKIKKTTEQVPFPPEKLSADVLKQFGIYDKRSSQLIKLINKINHPELEQFVSIVLSNPLIATPFFNCKASWSFHHSVPGGLLKHSLEVAEMVFAWPGMDTTERAIATVAALLHDIGKIRTFGPDGSTYSRLIQHDALTLEVLANGLHWLDGVDKEIALALRHLFTAASPGARYGKPAMMRIAYLIHFADRWSSETDLQDMATPTKNGFKSWKGNDFWSPQDNDQ